MKIYTANDLANQLGVTPQTITRNAGLHGIGVKVSSVWMFQQSDICKMRIVLDDNYKRDFARMGRAAMAKRWHGKEV